MVSIADIKRAIESVAPGYGLASAELFGSYARGEQTPDSDIDIVVELSRPLGFKRAELPDALQSILSVPVDVIFGKSQLYAPVRAEFERDKVALYEA